MANIEIQTTKNGTRFVRLGFNETQLSILLDALREYERFSDDPDTDSPLRARIREAHWALSCANGTSGSPR